MTYYEARRYLDSLAFHGMKLGLANTSRLLARLGGPHMAYQTIHVGGTNGKGSTCAAISSILSAAGISNGLYTSPHQVSFRERILVDGVMIHKESAAALIGQVKEAAEGMGLTVTYFEFLTAVAFLHFAQTGVKAVALEVGLGGRFDSTNVVDPAVSIITSVAMDHMAHLGDTLERIAMEKCGVIKPGRPLVLGVKDGPAAAEALRTAKERGSEVQMAGRDFTAARVGMTADGELLDYASGMTRLTGLKTGLRGHKQVDNAALAATTALILRRRGMNISDGAIRRGLEGTRIPGRFETVLQKPLLIMDGAHNPDAAEALCQTILERFGPGRADIVFGAMRDKDYPAMIKALAPAARSFLFYSPQVPRAEDPARLAAAQADPAIPTKVAVGAGEVLAMIRSAGEERLIVITGSFYTIGEIRAAMGETPVDRD
jgi:dihydrofolate synthase/folylpolyglutamate synthase